MLDVKMDIFTYPGESGCCPLQPSKTNNMNLTAEMKQLKLVFMQQQTMRMVDYYFHQIMGLIKTNTKKELEAPSVDRMTAS